MQYMYYTDPVTGLRARDGIREIDVDGVLVKTYVIDSELIVGGFNGTENLDWGFIGGAV